MSAMNEFKKKREFNGISGASCKNMLFEFDFGWIVESCFRINHQNIIIAERYFRTAEFICHALVTGNCMTFRFCSFLFDRHLLALHMQIEFLFAEPKYERIMERRCFEATRIRIIQLLIDLLQSDKYGSGRMNEWRIENQDSSNLVSTVTSFVWILTPLMTINECGNLTCRLSHTIRKLSRRNFFPQLTQLANSCYLAALPLISFLAFYFLIFSFNNQFVAFFYRRIYFILLSPLNIFICILIALNDTRHEFTAGPRCEKNKSQNDWTLQAHTSIGGCGVCAV